MDLHLWTVADDALHVNDCTARHAHDTSTFGERAVLDDDPGVEFEHRKRTAAN